MFNNIGKKIKILAKVITILGFIVSSIIPTVCLIFGLIEGEILALELGARILFFGCLFSWIGSFLLYGFGELIDKTTEIANNMTKINKNGEQNIVYLSNIANQFKKDNNIIFNKGKIVSHKYFGNGEIISVTQDKIIVDFSTSGKGPAEMELDIDFCLQNELLTMID